MNLRKISVYILLLVLGFSAFSNLYLFNSAEKYYFRLQETRLDPIGINQFDETLQTIIDSGNDTDGKRVIFFGDSRAADWPAPSLDDFSFYNAGIGGQTSEQIIERFDDHIETADPDIIIVQLCINDLKTIPLFPSRKDEILLSCKDNIKQLISMAHNSGIIVVLTTVFPVGHAPLQRRLYWSNDIASAVVEINDFILAQEKDGVVVFDTYSILVNDDGLILQEYAKDELHLNSSGYQVLNDHWILLLKEMI